MSAPGRKMAARVGASLLLGSGGALPRALVARGGGDMAALALALLRPGGGGALASAGAALRAARTARGGLFDVEASPPPLPTVAPTHVPTVHSLPPPPPPYRCPYPCPYCTLPLLTRATQAWTEGWEHGLAALWDAHAALGAGGGRERFHVVVAGGGGA